MRQKNINKTSLNIGIVCYPSVGGSGIVATALGSELSRRGHNVHFISYDPPFNLDMSKPNIFFHKVELSEHQLFKYPDYTLPLAVKIVAVSSEFKLDVLHVHYAIPHATAALLAKSIANEEKIPFPHVVATLHGTDITLLARDRNLMPMIKYSIESSCGVTSVSESLKKDTQNILKTRKKIKVIYNFYDPKVPGRDPFSVRRELGIRDNDFLMIHMSNLRKFKRIPDLLLIMSKLKAKKNIKLLILAGGNFSQYEELVDKYNIRSQIIVRENIQDIENYISAADAGIYTSDEESFGMAILETMSYGKPVLATKIGGIPEFMINKKTGFLLDPGDIPGFVRAISMLYNNKKLRQSFGARAEAQAKKFSSATIVDQYLKYYEDIMKICR